MISNFWNEVEGVTSIWNWQHVMYQNNWYDKPYNFLIVDIYPDNGITQETTWNFDQVLQELHHKFDSDVAWANPSFIVSGDLLNANDKSPLVNTLYHNFQKSHLQSTFLKIQQVFDKDNQRCIPVPVTVAHKLTDVTRRTLHSRHVHHLCTRLQDIFPSGTLSQL